jgi:hypothetical protein
MSECSTVEPVITVSIYYGPDEEDLLVIPPTCDDDEGLWWNSLALPDWGVRYNYAPPSIWVPGSIMLGAVADSSTLALRVVARGSDADGLETQKALLASRLFTGAMVVGIDADYGTVTPAVTNLGLWRARPVIPSWGPVTPQRAGMLFAETTLSIPVEPPGAP